MPNDNETTSTTFSTPSPNVPIHEQESSPPNTDLATVGPDKEERRRLRRQMNTAGASIILLYVLPDVLFTILMFIVLAAMGISFSEYASGAANDGLLYFEDSSIYISLNALIFICCNLGVAMLGLRAIHVRPARLFAPREHISGGDVARYIAIGIGIQAFIGIIYTIVDYFASTSDVDLIEADFSYYDTPKSTIIVLLYTCILAPITEEIFYRGFLLKCLSPINVRLAVGISALAFGLAHGNISQGLLAFFLGIFLGKIVTRTGSLFPSICVHVGINTFATLLDLIDTKGSDTAIVLSALLYYAIAVIGIVLWFVTERKKPLPYFTPKQQARNRVFWSTPWLLIAFGVMVLTLILNNL